MDINETNKEIENLEENGENLGNNEKIEENSNYNSIAEDGKNLGNNEKIEENSESKKEIKITKIKNKYKNFNSYNRNKYNPKTNKPNNRNIVNEALKVPIEQVARKLGLPITSENTTKCINPSHFDQASSMEFNKNNNRYQCFNCGASGNSIDMVSLILRITKIKSAEWILDKVENTEEYKKFIPEDRKKKGLTSKSKSSSEIFFEKKEKKKKYSGYINREKDSIQKQNKYFKERDKLLKSGEIYKMYRLVTNSITPISEIRINIGFIVEKGIKSEVTDNLGIGIIINPTSIEEELIRKFNVTDLIASGLFIGDENKNSFKFAFKEYNVIFPYISGKSVVNIQGRRLDDKKPMYITTSYGQPFIYNYNLLKNINNNKTLIICDDIIDAVSLISKGFDVINVAYAEKFRNEWVKIIPTKNILLVSDDDNVKNRIGTIFSKNKIDIKVTNYNKISGITSKRKMAEAGEIFEYKRIIYKKE